MKEYPTKGGKYGPTYLIAEGIMVWTSKSGTYEVVVNHHGEREKRRYGKDLETAAAKADQRSGRNNPHAGLWWSKPQIRREGYESEKS